MRAAILADFETELQVCLRYGVLQAAGHRRGGIGRYLGKHDRRCARPRSGWPQRLSA
jgi:hypothetical protein